jgi:hypothetical protein
MPTVLGCASAIAEEMPMQSRELKDGDRKLSQPLEYHARENAK